MNSGLLVAVVVMAASSLLTGAALLIIAVESWIDQHLTKHRLRRDVEAMWREVYRTLDEADELPRPARPLKRGRVAGVRIPLRPIRRHTSTSNSERH